MGGPNDDRSMDMLPKETIENPEELSQLIDKYGDIIIDGVETPCVRPQDEERQKDRYSGKKTPYRESACSFQSSATLAVRQSVVRG